jgi:hypothetical protein
LHGEIERKVIVGLALEFAYNNSPGSVSQLLALWEDSDVELMEETGKRMLESAEPETRAVGLLLQQGLGKATLEPDPIAWRDLALDMYGAEVNLIFNMCRIREMSLKEKDEAKKKTLTSIYGGFQRWQAGVSNAISFLRSSEWTHAKISIEEAFLSSTSTTLDSVLTFNVGIKDGLKSLREKTGKFRGIIMEYPSKLPFSAERAPTIARLQEQLLALHEIGRANESDPIVFDAVNYPIEKLETAVDYLVEGEEIATANYEVGIASTHLKGKVRNISGTVGANLRRIASAVEIIFSELPAKPWSVPGYGAPGVESRFEGDEEETNRG